MSENDNEKKDNKVTLRMYNNLAFFGFGFSAGMFAVNFFLAVILLLASMVAFGIYALKKDKLSGLFEEEKRELSTKKQY